MRHNTTKHPNTMRTNYCIVAKANQANGKTTTHNKSIGEYDREDMISEILLAMNFANYCDGLKSSIEQNKYAVCEYKQDCKNLQATITTADGSTIEISVEAA